MADVPNKFVVGGIENLVQCDRQFDYPETCSQVTARDGNCIDRLGPQFIRNLPKVPCIDTA